MKKQLNENPINELTNKIKSFYNIMPYKDIIQFALQDIDLSGDISSDKVKVDLENYHYMIQPLSKCVIDKGIRKEVVLCWPQQFGKSLIENICITHSILYNKLQALLVYPSLDLAMQQATVKLKPILQSLPQFKEELEKPFAIRNDRIKLSNAVLYMQGSGSRIIGKSAKLVLIDQASFLSTDKGEQPIVECKKRTRTYSECLLMLVSSPHYKEDGFWQQFLSGTQGYYYLRCQGCGQLTMRSADIHNLQFQSVYSEEQKLYKVVKGSCRLVCPKCGFEHEQLPHRKRLIADGGYIHKFPQRQPIYSYQCGVLASNLQVHNWQNLGQICLSSGKSATLNDYITFDNSYRGLPYQGRNYNKQDETALSKHFYKDFELKKQDIECIFISADTQDTFSVVGTFALTKDNNIYLMNLQRLKYLYLDDEQRKIIDSENIRNGKDKEITVLDRVNQLYFDDIKPLICLVDSRGHRTDEIKRFSRLQKNIIMYAGTNLKYDNWKFSQNIQKLILADSRRFQAELIFMLYAQTNKQTNYLYLTERLSAKDLQQITSFQPDNTKRDGNLYENWTCGNNVHDTFDVIKMGLCALSVMPKIFRQDKFRFYQANRLKMNQKPHKPKRPNINRKQNNNNLLRQYY